MSLDTPCREEEMPVEAAGIPAEELVDTKEDAQRIEDIKKTGNVDGYISKLHDMLVRIKAIEKRAEEIKDKHLQDQATLDKDKKDLNVVVLWKKITFKINENSYFILTL